MGEDLKFIIEALNKIRDLKEDSGAITCPKCKGNLNYTRAKSNGHVWGKCKTDDCLSWMM